MTKRRWIEYLVAVIVGNAIYFAVLHPGLPPAFQNQPNRVDLGLVVDFLCCVLVYVTIRLAARHARRSTEGRHSSESRPPRP